MKFIGARSSHLLIICAFLQLRVKCLVSIGKMVTHMDKWFVLDEVLPFLPQIPSREPAILMAILGKSTELDSSSSNRSVKRYTLNWSHLVNVCVSLPSKDKFASIALIKSSFGKKCTVSLRKPNGMIGYEWIKQSMSFRLTMSSKNHSQIWRWRSMKYPTTACIAA